MHHSRVARGNASSVYLGTLTPATHLLEAFGHVVLVFEEPRGRIAYGYGGFEVPKVHLHVRSNDADGWRDGIASAALQLLAPLARGELPARKIEEPLTDTVRKARCEQALILDEIRLTPQQVVELRRRVKADFARIEPGQSGARRYFFDHFQANCATRLRDLIFQVLGRDAENALYSHAPVDESLRSVVEDALTEAIKQTPGGFQVIPPRFVPLSTSLVPGVPCRITCAEDFFSGIAAALDALSHTPAFVAPQGRAVVERAKELLHGRLGQRPLAYRDTLITPARLRRALATWPSPTGSGPVLDTKRATVLGEMGQPIPE